MIPDAPNLPPWVIAYAEYEGQAVALKRFGREIIGDDCPGPAYWTVTSPMSPLRGTNALGDCQVVYCCTYNEAEARGVFGREAERLRHVDS